MNLSNLVKYLFKYTLKVLSGYDLQKSKRGILVGSQANIEANFLSSSCAILIEKSSNEVEKNWQIYKYLYQSKLKTILQKYSINLVIDVGANTGQFASLLRAIGYQGKIISFEPVSTTFKILLAKSENDPNWDVYQLALGSENKTQEIYVANDSVFSSLLETNSFCNQKFGDSVARNKAEIVKIQRLDDFLNEYSVNLSNINLYLKMDTQGYDLEVFDGLGEMYNNVSALQTEMSVIALYKNMPHFTSSISSFENKGFDLVGIYPVSQDRQSLKLIEFDCLMTNSNIMMS
ncbi:FkbM family methyltransferase [Nodularia spumigena CS-591/12]|uniref:FkbM family methyltransferase n=1 Tax=Nodularia spumigena TaxID=70799 RepID=UPI00232E31CB|nr:FkbM family methyltransferase [Nodularia spumigena]MDB9304550.1 FkbM family methyltransferase [Nodularia spumigena CS-591/12]